MLSSPWSSTRYGCSPPAPTRSATPDKHPREVSAGTRDANSIDESAIQSRLYTAGLPDPDLLIRTGGELRISNFLLFQIAYSELWSTAVNWPAFDDRLLH